MTGWKDTRPSALDPATRFAAPPDRAVLRRLHDAHCHPTDDDHFSRQALTDLDTPRFCVMSSSLTNQDKAKVVHDARPDAVIPCFGLHPWFSHPISFAPPASLPTREDHYAALFPPPDANRLHPTLAYLLPHLPDPVSIDLFLAQLESNLLAYPTSYVGEVGLDKAFRIPHPPALLLAAESNPLPKNSDLSTPIEHQLRVVERQLDLAIRLGRNVSQHCVRSTAETVELLDRYRRDKPGFGRIHVCLHSFGASAETAKQIQRRHSNVFFSFSTIVSGRSPHFHKLLRAIEPDRLLVESDFSDTREIDHQIWEVFEAICQARGWSVEEAASTLERNWDRFTRPVDERPNVDAAAPRASGKQRKREKRQVDLYVSEDDEDRPRGQLGIEGSTEGI
ncbi:hypothetical protein JCM11491_004821 [Sporobolomyces phaffii]